MSVIIVFLKVDGIYLEVKEFVGMLCECFIPLLMDFYW